MRKFGLALALIGMAACNNAPIDNAEWTIPENCSAYVGVDRQGETVKNTLRCDLVSGETERFFFLYIPEAYKAQTSDVPLLMSLHGYTSRAVWHMGYTGFQPIADREGFLLAYPHGEILQSSGETHWNVGGWTLGSQTDDVEFLNDMIAFISDNFAVDTDRIYSAGMSNGGFMSYHLACQPGSQLAAIASVTGSMTHETFDTCRPDGPVPVLQKHGGSDATVPVTGNEYSRALADVMAFWTANNECEAGTAEENLEDVNKDGIRGVHSLSTSCALGADVEYMLLDNYEHKWPISGNGDEVHAADEIWNFLSRYDSSGKIE